MRVRAMFVATCVVVLAGVAALPVRADMPAAGARSTSSAVLGAEGWYAGALPPPGLHLLDYTLYYRAHELKGRKGRHVDGFPLTDYEVRVIANVIRPIYVSDRTIFGANPAWHAVIPIMAMKQTTDVFKDSMEGVGDIYVSPLILGWHRPPWHYVAGLDVIMPTGHYSKHDFTTIGHNHWTFEPAFAISYIGQSGFSASTKLMYDMHTEDHSLDYKEGDQFHLDYNVGCSFGANKEWKVGVCGYFLTSLEEDKSNSRRVKGSEESVFAVGPTVAYQKGKWLVALKVQKELEAENRPKGIASWIKVCYSF